MLTHSGDIRNLKECSISLNNKTTMLSILDFVLWVGKFVFKINHLFLYFVCFILFCIQGIFEDTLHVLHSHGRKYIIEEKLLHAQWGPRYAKMERVLMVGYLTTVVGTVSILMLWEWEVKRPRLQDHGQYPSSKSGTCPSCPLAPPLSFSPTDFIFCVCHSGL